MATAETDTPTFPVQLYVYDLTNGMARALSPMLLGHQVEGVWHSALVVHGMELFFGYGTHRTNPGTTPFGQPYKKIDLGVTQIDKEMVLDMVSDLGRTNFRPQDYNLISHNCNHFTNELSTLLCGSGIPAEYLTQHEVLLRSPMGQALMPMLSQMESVYGAATAEGFAAASGSGSTTNQGGRPAGR